MKITFQEVPNRRNGCLGILIFMLLLSVVFVGTSLFQVPKIEPDELIYEPCYEDFEPIKRYPEELHNRSFCVTGTITSSSYFYIGGYYRLQDEKGRSILIFTKRIPATRGTVVEERFLYLEVIGTLDTWRLHVQKELPFESMHTEYTDPDILPII